MTSSASTHSELIDDLDAVLPQTQCRQCGYDGCRPYAAAIAGGAADVDRCPPGGDAGIARIAAIVGRAPIPLNTACGVSKPLALAVIDEALCIGCTLCIQACPVDAIVGGAKRMHDVVADLCTGCELCLPPCPVDCIALVPAGFVWGDRHAVAARERHEARARRLVRLNTDAASNVAVERTVAAATKPSRKQAIVAAAVERASGPQRRRLAAPRTPADGER